MSGIIVFIGRSGKNSKLKTVKLSRGVRAAVFLEQAEYALKELARDPKNNKERVFKLIGDERRQEVVKSMIDQKRKGHELTFRQENFLIKISEDAIKNSFKPTPAPVPGSGRMLIEGEVVSVKLKDTRYGLQYKMLVLSDEGFKVWGSVPKAMIEDGVPVVGPEDRVSFEADVEPSDRDETFGFFKKPVVA